MVAPGTPTSQHSGEQRADPLDAGNIEALLCAEHGAPFDILGQHQMTLAGQETWILRAFVPGARSVSAVARGATAPAVPLHPLRDEGLFSGLAAQPLPQPYDLQIEWQNGDVVRRTDPYTLPPRLTDYDLYLIGEGKHLHLFDRLGAHPVVHEGVEGVAFAVWAPNARRVAVVGDFNGWDDRLHPMRLRRNGVWELCVPGAVAGQHYKYAILSWNDGYRVLKADPLAFWAEVRPSTASRIAPPATYTWQDDDWMRAQATHNAAEAPISVYELHAGSWRPTSAGGAVTYRDLAHQVVPYVREQGFTHIELMPVAEHPFDGSWGYQVTGYYAPTSRYGTPEDFMYFVDYCHRHGVGVLMDWVPAHFPRDEHGLAYFDGTHLYEHADPRQGAHPDWGTLIFNFARNEVRNFLLANALYWVERFHVDGLRVDAVASMIYLDYSRREGEWLPNRYNGRDNLEAIEFVRECNATLAARHPGVLMIAEESTAWAGVTARPEVGGLGFSLKWNMGWMHDVLEYMHHEPVHRKFHHSQLTFSMIYAYSERFLLPFSHDEVVHMKGSMLNKMPGDTWQKFANLRALYGFMFAHPGKKLLFMGDEFGQWAEWNFAGFLDWYLLDLQSTDGALHRQLQTLVRDLNGLLREQPALHEVDFAPEGFEWIDGSDTAQSVISFVRYDHARRAPLLVVCNFTPVPRYGYHVGVPRPGTYRELLNTDAKRYGGSNVGNLSEVASVAVPAHGRAHSIPLTLPPLATVVLQPR